MWRNSVEPDRPQKTIWCIHFTCSISKLQIHTQNMQHSFVFLHAKNGNGEHASMLRYNFIACYVHYFFSSSFPPTYIPTCRCLCFHPFILTHFRDVSVSTSAILSNHGPIFQYSALRTSSR